MKPVNGVYDYTKQVISFIGYAPVDDPKIAILVLIDEPKDSELGGGAAAAPVFQKIANQTLQYLGVPKKFDEASSKSVQESNPGVKTPDLKKLSLQEAKNLLKSKGISYATLGSGTELISQFPKAGATLKAGQHMYLLTEEGKAMSIPSLKGNRFAKRWSFSLCFRFP